jgi:hypothetical protein
MRRLAVGIVAVACALLGSVTAAAATRSPPAPPPTTPASNGMPIGHLDAVSASPALVRLRGWAGDPDGVGTTRIQIAYDGYLMSHAIASWKRPDVQAVTGLPLNTGFSLALPILPGRHSVCVNALNTGPSGGLPSATIGCAEVTVPGAGPRGAPDPRGVLDALRSEYVQGVGLHFRPVGWAFDPDTPGPVTVRVRYLSREYFFDTNLDATRDVSTGVARPDVALMVPAAGPTAGFGTRFPVSDHIGVEVLCAYARNVGPGRDRLLGCRTGVDV